MKRTYSYLAVLLIFTLLFIAACGDRIPVTGPVDDSNGEEQEDPALRAQEEWERRNEELKEELGPYYVPLPPLEQPANPPVTVRGLYTRHSLGSAVKYHRFVELIEETELNAVVIDVKCIDGKMSYASEIEIVRQFEAYYQPVPITDIRSLLNDLQARGIYTIARISVFKDNHLPTRQAEWGLQLIGGGVYRDHMGAWVDPFRKEVSEYNIAIAKEAALVGFREIQFDYIRFPEGGAALDQRLSYHEREGRPKAEAIFGFIKKAQVELAPYNVYISHDVFGGVGTIWGDSWDLGQIWEDFTTHCDYLSPMIYPCHYGPGWFGFSVPNSEPAGVITAALIDALKRNATLNDPATIRPWLKSWHYGAAEIRAQIDAALALGIEEYLLWDPRCENYPRDAFVTADQAERNAAELQEQREREGRDLLGRTPREAVEVYLEAIQKKKWLEAYVLQRTGQNGSPEEGARYRDWLIGSNSRLTDWEIRGAAPVGNVVIIGLDVTVTLRSESITLAEETWTLAMENGIWRVRPSTIFLELIEGKAGGEQG